MCLEPCIIRIPNLKQYHVYIDGNNVAYFRFNQQGKPVLSDILSLISYLIEELGFLKENIHCICDPSLRHYIDKLNEFEALIKEGVLIEAPKVADEFILSFALKENFCFIISNDKFREYIDQLPSKQWLEDRRISFMVIDEEICLSPNFDLNRIDALLLEEEENEDNEHDRQERTTLDILERIENTEGEFELF